MTRRTKTGKSLTDDELDALADEFEKTDFGPDDVAAIKARADATTESQVIRGRDRIATTRR